jgi:hypothetical protein
MAEVGAAPQAAVVEPVRRTDIRSVDSSDLANDAMAFLSEEQAAPPPKKPRKPVAEPDLDDSTVAPVRPKKGEPLAEPEGEEEEGGEGVGDPADDDDEGAPDDEVDDPDHEEQPTLGTKEKPYPAKDLPDDRFCTVKVEGEEVTVDFAEMARGYIGWATTTKRLNAAKDLTAKAEAAIAQTNEFRQGVTQQINELLDDPDRLYELLLDRNEDVLLGVGQKLAKRLRAFAENPNLALQDRAERLERIHAEKRRKFDEERQAAEEQRRQQQVFEERRKMFQPGWADGLKRAGFPELNQKTQQALYEEVLLRCQQRSQAGLQVTSQDVSDFTLRASKLLELKPKAGKPAPQQARPVAPPPKAKANGKSNGAAPFSRHDPDSFLRGLNTREFRR